MIGTLEIEEQCVYVQPEGEQDRLLVLFSSANTSWDPDTEAILGTAGNGIFSRFLSGDTVELGGGFGQQNSLESFTWVLEPDQSCDTTRLWIASTIS